jgi:acyl-CoA thioesterase
MNQAERPILRASAWMVDSGMSGLEHDVTQRPPVLEPEALAPYSRLAETYQDWPRLWKVAVEGRPARWSDEPGDPVWHTWLRLMEPVDLEEAHLNAARSVMWMDTMMWNAAVPPHLPGPTSHFAPNLDLAVSFHNVAAKGDWLLCDAESPLGADGLLGCSGRVWSQDGQLIASGSSTLFCRPNPRNEGGSR